MNKKDINKIIEDEVREYKMGLLLESFIPIFSSRVHSIPDVVGPVKLITDIGILVTIGIMMCSGVSATLLGIAIGLTAFSGITTINLYITDYDEKAISDIKREALKNAQINTTNTKEKNSNKEKQKKKSEETQISKNNVNVSFSNNVELTSSNNHKKSKVLVKEK